MAEKGSFVSDTMFFSVCVKSERRPLLRRMQPVTVLPQYLEQAPNVARRLGVERTLSACMGGPYCSLSKNLWKTLSSDNACPAQAGQASATAGGAQQRTPALSPQTERSLPSTPPSAVSRRVRRPVCARHTVRPAKTGMAFNGGSESRLLMPVGATV